MGYELQPTDKLIIYYRPLFPGRKTSVVTVCLLLDTTWGNLMARGIAICSEQDEFLKRVGRAKAVGRAIKAVTRQRNTEEIGRSRFMGFVWDWKSEYNPTLTDFEERLVERQLKGVVK